MKCVILQPSYIPWRGYFHQIAKADVFVFYDDVQYDTRGWRNRNRIKTPQGVRWLTIPVHKRGAQTENIPIHQIKIAWERPWNEEHWRTVTAVYRYAPYFERYAELLEPFFQRQDEYLADFTIDLTVALAGVLGIHGTRFLRSSDLGVSGTKTERLIQVLQQVGADHYISGPAARSYLDENLFAAAGIGLEYMVYDYSEYPQLYPPYEPQVSIIDLLVMTGPEALEYISPGER
jgi:hypothetical protein